MRLRHDRRKAATAAETRARFLAEAEAARKATVAVKVIDIFGNDTMALVPVNIG